jgi:UDP-glucose 4-epimerase
MATCLVTGGAGFIGSHLVEALVDRGHVVRVLDNFSTGNADNLAEVEGRIRLIVGDLMDFALVREAVQGADYVFHEAAPVEPALTAADPMATHHGGATGTLHVLMAAHQASVKRVIYASSCCVYGPANGLPRHEEEPTQPLSLYAVAKLTGEQHCIGFTGIYGLETVRLRYFNVFGPRQPSSSPYSTKVAQILSDMMAGRRPVIHGGTLDQQDLIYVDDVVHANLLAALAPRVAGRVYNIACGRPTTTLELVTRINTILGTQIQPIGVFPSPGEEQHNLADVTKAETELGFCSSTDLEQGLRRCIEYYMPRREELAC